MPHPNIVVLMADQLAAAALPFYGNTVVKAPNMQRLAREGVVFDNSYCNSPLCAPSRFSFMSGRLPSRIGAHDNAAEFPATVPTFCHYLRRMGYRTCLAGKMHFVGPDQLHGFEERLTTDIYPSDFGWVCDWDRPGRRHDWYHNMLSVVQAGVCHCSNQLDFDEQVAFAAVRWLYDAARGADSRPFLLTVSFTHPHDPFAILPDCWERYDHAAIDMPAVDCLPDERLDAHSRRLRRVYDYDRYAITPERIRNARHAYYGAVSYLDDKIGQVLDTLKRTGLLDDTIVLLCADHGEMLGERGLWYKMSFFEGSARVPLVVRAPARFAPRRVRQPVSLVDVLPTLMALGAGDGGVEPVEPLDGRSLLPLLDGQPEDENAAVYGEYLAEGAEAPILMIRRGRFKFIFSRPDPDQLYDLAGDPHELCNLAAQPDHAERVAAFHHEIKRRWNPDGLYRQVVENQRRRRLVFEAQMQGRHTPWDFQPHQDASQMYMRNHKSLDDLELRSRLPAAPVPTPDGATAVQARHEELP